MPDVFFQKTAVGKQVPSIEGHLFCSARNPEREAQAWFNQQLPFLRNPSEILILGLGAGLHLEQILQSTVCPRDIFVVEKHEELVNLWKKQGFQNRDRVQFVPVNSAVNENLVRGVLILEFRPAWVGNEKFYEELSISLRGPSIKEITSQLTVQDQTKQAKIWRALREMVR